MKVKVHLDHGETLEDAEEFLVKSLAHKKDFNNSERYSDAFLNELHDHVVKQHSKLIDTILKEVKQEIEQHAHSKNYL
jgi:hypothetical protein